jgi:hypothetical protein
MICALISYKQDIEIIHISCMISILISYDIGYDIIEL